MTSITLQNGVNLTIWFSTFKKTKTMLLSKQQKLHKLPSMSLNISVNGKTLQSTSSEKLLGVIIDQSLSWKNHINRIHRTVSMVLNHFKNIKHCLPEEARITYCLYVPAHGLLQYSLGPAQGSKLDKLIKKAARMIYDKPSITHSQPLLQKLKWMSVQERVHYRRITQIYKTINNQAPTYLQSHLTFVKDIHQNNTKL